MPHRCYLAPAGFVPAVFASQDGNGPPKARRLVGLRDLAFSCAELIERRETGVRSRLLSVAELEEALSGTCPAPSFADGALKRDYERIRAPRPPVAGISLDRPRIMGIVNVTPDSFSDGGFFATAAAAAAHGLRLAEEGADILDIGGESTRPGARPVPLDEELRRVLPVIEGLRGRTATPISIDTRKAEVMRRAAEAGAAILNDVSALRHDPASLETAAATGLPVVLMHAQGDPGTMNDAPRYDDVRLDVFDFLAERIAACEAAGLPRERLIADPGIGFGKHLHHNVALLSKLALLHGLGVPVLLGASRKKLIGQLCNVEAPAARVPGSLAAVLAGLAQGVQIVRVHDVAATRQALSVWQAIGRGTEKELA